MQIPFPSPAICYLPCRHGCVFFLSFFHSIYRFCFLPSLISLTIFSFICHSFQPQPVLLPESLFLWVFISLFWDWPGEVSMCVSPGTVCVHPCLDTWLCLVLAALCTHQMFTYIILLLVGHRFQGMLSLLFQHHLHLFNNMTAWFSSFWRDFVFLSKRSLVTAIKAAALCNKSVRFLENHWDMY